MMLTFTPLPLMGNVRFAIAASGDNFLATWASDSISATMATTPNLSLSKVRMTPSVSWCESANRTVRCL